MDINKVQEFLNTNNELILRIFPDLDNDTENPEVRFNHLQTLVWETTQNDPLMKKLGQEQFYSLPLEKKLPIILQLLQLMDILKKAEELTEI